MQVKTPQVEQDRSRTQSPSDQSQGNHGGQNPVIHDDRQDDDLNGANPTEQVDRGSRDNIGNRDNGDDAQGRSGKSVVHPDDENTDDPNEETANSRPM